MKSFFDYIWNTKWALALSAGILFGLSFPPFPLPFLVFPAFLYIFRIINLSESAREAAYWTYPAFLIWNIITTYWLMMATLAGGAAAILANAVLMTVPVMLQYKIQQQTLKPWLIALFQAAFWLSFEYLHHQWQLAWPWLTIGNAWSNVPQLIQYISVTGYWGISFWVLFGSALAFQQIQKPQRSTKLIFGIVLFAFPLWSTAITFFSNPSQPQSKHEVAVIQPNFDSYQAYGGFPNAFQASSYLLRLTDSVRTPNTTLIVWPENAVQSNMTNSNYFGDVATHIKNQLKAKANEWGATILTGASYYQYYNQQEAPSLTYNNKRGAFLPFNAALGFSPNQPIQVYRKHNLVPIVERVPYVHSLEAIDIFDWVNWGSIQGYGKGYQTNPFSVGETKTPALICYDSVFPSWVRKYVEHASGYITIITNDGWWGNTSGHLQHFAYARLRAIEMDRWIIRSANNGISGIIAPDGSIKVETPYWKATAFRYEVPVLTSQTWYVRFGDWLPALMLILSVFGIGAILRNKFFQPDQDFELQKR